MTRNDWKDCIANLMEHWQTWGQTLTPAVAQSWFEVFEVYDPAVFKQAMKLYWNDHATLFAPDPSELKKLCESVIEGNKVKSERQRDYEKWYYSLDDIARRTEDRRVYLWRAEHATNQRDRQRFEALASVVAGEIKRRTAAAAGKTQP